ncbi:hypothetical protein N7533_011454 [Penicillium manginii]|jgi:hypothetical protein|uniref:uncharacterized protein n=1 Tax=Penicillium manginii TaxID=203109 RepID=UPI0025474709|nr:uncharacterized protein N7533_011454 [Penicillium manginii]KAJ5742045.1 hypothetical protein N7533_011454 [Penicillium manginii]
MNALVEETDISKFYHHPTWPHRWFHPEFTDEAIRTWQKELCNSGDRCLGCRFLRNLGTSGSPWGYIIYRTVYTPESEELWPIAMEKLTRLTFCEFEAEFKNHHVNARNSRPERLVKEAHKNVIISDPDYWNGAGIETIRAHFAEYLRAAGEYKSIGTSRFGGCLVIDERSLKSIIATTDPFNERGERQWGNVGFVGMVDGRYEQGIKYDIPSYKGFMRVRVRNLWWMYINFDFKSMDDLCHDVPDGLIPVYDGGDGQAHDEEGNDCRAELANFRERHRAGRRLV